MQNPRQLILCFDGTNNSLTGGVRDTHVVRLLELLEPGKNKQLTYYDPGVGNAGRAPGVDFWDKTKARFDRLKGLALGGGIYDNIAQGYLFLVHNYEPGDDIFLFGFSRGAFTARSVGGMVARFGLLRPEHAGMIDTLLHLYFSDGVQRGSKNEREYRATLNQIRGLCARRDGPNQADPTGIPIWFSGVWDTVESVGLPGLGRKISGSPTILGKAQVHVRHALALDEYRTQFLPRMYAVHPDASKYEAAGQSLKQQWFSGSHCDVGGGYLVSEAALAETAFEWLIGEAADQKALGGRQLRLAAPPESKRTANARAEIHSELAKTPLWALTGMRIRNPHHNPLTKLSALDPKHPKNEHTAGNVVPSAPDGTKLQTFHFGALFWVSCVLAGFFYLLHGAVLLKGSAALMSRTGHEWLEAALLRLPAKLDAVYAANLAFLNFQLTAFWSATLEPAKQQVNGMGALAWDFLLILAYGVVLSYLSAWAFSRLAGARSGLSPTRSTHALNFLGQMPMWVVVADGLENLCTAFVLTAWAQDYLPTLVQFAGLTMAVFAATKLAALAMCIGLVAWAIVAKPKP